MPLVLTVRTGRPVLVGADRRLELVQVERDVRVTLALNPGGLITLGLLEPHRWGDVTLTMVPAKGHGGCRARIMIDAPEAVAIARTDRPERIKAGAGTPGTNGGGEAC